MCWVWNLKWWFPSLDGVDIPEEMKYDANMQRFHTKKNLFKKIVKTYYKSTVQAFKAYYCQLNSLY